MSSAAHRWRAPKLPKISELFDDSVEFWTGYPYITEPILHRPTLYLRERCKLAELFEEMHTLILSDERPREAQGRTFHDNVARVSDKMLKWYEQMPLELHYEVPANVAIWEFQYSPLRRNPFQSDYR